MTDDWWKNRRTIPKLESNPDYCPDCSQCIWRTGYIAPACNNPKQTDEDKKEYLYVGFNCQLFEYPQIPSKEIYML